jgi:hypothetical protein
MSNFGSPPAEPEVYPDQLSTINAVIGLSGKEG